MSALPAALVPPFILSLLASSVFPSLVAYSLLLSSLRSPSFAVLTGTLSLVAVALAARMLPLADGSDMGGSLRNPASFCNVVGFRTSADQVPACPVPDDWSNLSVLGPMARTVSIAH